MKRGVVVVLAGLLASVAHAGSVNLYRVRGAPMQPKTVVALTNYSEGEAYPLNILRVERVVVDAHGITTVAYRVGTFHELDGPEEATVGSPLGDFVVTATRVRWIEFPASSSRFPTSICYDIRAEGTLARNTVETTDGFGTQTVKLSRPEVLCVPATVAMYGDPYYYGPAYPFSQAFPIPPAGPVRLCFNARAQRPVVRPAPTTVATFFGGFVARIEPIKEYCVDATIAVED